VGVYPFAVNYYYYYYIASPFLAEAKYLFLLQSVPTVPEVHPTSNSEGNDGQFPKTPHTAEVSNE
jgi:hypothetical protein